MKYILFLIIVLTISVSVIFLQKPIIEGGGKKKKKKKKRAQQKDDLRQEAGGEIVWEDQSLTDMKLLAQILEDDKNTGNTDYSYDNKIKAPKDIGISKKGEWDNVEKNIVGLNSYVDALISGKSRAVIGGQPLGDKKFVDTGIKCKDSDDVEHDRYFYVNNVPHSKTMGGLIPGAISKFGEFDVNAIGDIFSSSDDNTKNICSPITMQTINNAHSVVDETHHVTIGDQETISPCSYPSGKNPITDEECTETFSNIRPTQQIPNDNLIKIYYGMIGSLGLYIVFCTLRKKC
jgi:hypothetical protein